MKKYICVMILGLLFIFNNYNVKAADGIDLNEIYEQQFKISGADSLIDDIPNEAKKTLDDLDIKAGDWDSLLQLNPNRIFSQIIGTVKQQLPDPLKSTLSVLGIMLLSALLEGMKLSFGSKPISGVVGVVSTLCISISIILQIVNTIAEASKVISDSANFMLAYIPVITGIMIASGQTVSAVSYHMTMVTVGELISQIVAKFLIPLLNVFLSISVVSAISPRMNLSGICKNINTVVKWVLGFVMSVFVSILTLQSFVGTAADDTGIKTIKFAISSFVPIVGSALSDAFSTVRECVKLLKSSIGAFGVLAEIVIFLPIITKCLIWMLSLNVCASVGDVFDLKQISTLLRSTGSVVSTMLAIILCCMTILTISTVLVLIIGGAVG